MQPSRGPRPYKPGKTDAALVRPQGEAGIRRFLVLVCDPADDGADIFLAGPLWKRGLEIQRIGHLPLAGLVHRLHYDLQWLSEAVRDSGGSGRFFVARFKSPRISSAGLRINAYHAKTGIIYEATRRTDIAPHIRQR